MCTAAPLVRVRPLAGELIARRSEVQGAPTDLAPARATTVAAVTAVESRSDQEQRIHRLIRDAGGRLTVTARTVVAILIDAHQHLTAEDIIDEAQRRAPGIAPSTVYRLLQRLEELGAVEHIHSGHGPTFLIPPL